MRFRFERSWRFDMGVEDLWRALEDTSAYPRWWPWLRDARLPSLERDAEASFSVAARRPYRMHLRLRLTEVEPFERIAARVDGDLVGRAELRVAPEADGSSRAVVEWDLALQRPLMRALGAVGRGVLESGHEWVVRAGVRQFASAHGVDVVEIRAAGDRAASHIVIDGIVAGTVAGILSGAPSTAVALARRRPLLASTRAAGTLLGAPTIPRGLVAHTALSLGWGVLLSALVPRDASWAGRAAIGSGVGAIVAAVDLGLIAARWFPSVDDLPRPSQVADHLIFGAIVGLALGRPVVGGQTSRPDGPHRPEGVAERRDRGAQLRVGFAEGA